LGGTSTGISPPILLRTFGYSRPILVALRSLSLKPFSFGYKIKTPPIRFSQAGGQSAHKARPPNLELALTPLLPTAFVYLNTRCLFLVFLLLSLLSVKLLSAEFAAARELSAEKFNGTQGFR